MNTAVAPQHQAVSESLNFKGGLALQQRVIESALRCTDRLLVQLQEGSSFYLSADAVLRRAAERIAIKGISPLVHLQEQLMPAVLEMPNLLIDIARQMSWSEVYAMALNPFWKSPVQLQGAKHWASAAITHLPAKR